MITDYLDAIRPALDVDANGQADPLTDGLSILRYLFGLRGASLVSNAIGPGAWRNAAAIEAQIDALTPSADKLPAHHLWRRARVGPPEPHARHLVRPRLHGAFSAPAIGSETQVLVTATADPNSMLVVVSRRLRHQVNSNTCTTRMTSDRMVPIRFDARTYTLSVNRQGNGTVTSSPSSIACGNQCVASFPRDATVILTASAPISSRFVGWSGACSGTGTCQIPLFRDTVGHCDASKSFR